jgi:peptidyl-prolyl cis-trans isomerase A (cyclophilin A)
MRPLANVRTLVLSLALLSACNLTPPPAPSMRPVVQPEPSRPAPEAAQQAAPTPPPAPEPPPPPAAPPAPPMRDVAVQPRVMEPTSRDPLHGRFSLSRATRDLPRGHTIVAEIETSMGTFNCDLLDDDAPNTVANFVGLARGLRDFWDPVTGAWARRPFYDGSVFHRVIPDFMIQGGDILRSGTGGTGYEIPDENVQGHDAPGLLCMANHGPNTNGGQFFITEVAKPHLDGSYTIFGRCTPASLVARITQVQRNEQDMPYEPVEIRHVRITRQ